MLSAEVIFFFAGRELYTTTVSDFSGWDPHIYKDPLRTEQYNSKILSSRYTQIDKRIYKILNIKSSLKTSCISIYPSVFLKMLDNDDYVYFFRWV